MFLFHLKTRALEAKVAYYRRNYLQYLQLQYWRDLNKQLIYSNPRAKCFICHKTSREVTLLLHHVSYTHLFREKLGRDIYIICDDSCHKKIHFWFFGFIKTPMDRATLLQRMYILRWRFCIRNKQFGRSIWYLLLSTTT